MSNSDATRDQLLPLLEHIQRAQDALRDAAMPDYLDGKRIERYELPMLIAQLTDAVGHASAAHALAHVLFRQEQEQKDPTS